MRRWYSSGELPTTSSPRLAKRSLTGAGPSARSTSEFSRVMRDVNARVAAKLAETGPARA